MLRSHHNIRILLGVAHTGIDTPITIETTTIIIITKEISHTIGGTGLAHGTDTMATKLILLTQLQCQLNPIQTTRILLEDF